VSKEIHRGAAAGRADPAQPPPGGAASAGGGESIATYGHRTPTPRSVAVAWKHDRVLLAYLDESSSATRYYIGALMVDESAALPLIEALDKIMNDTAAAYPQLDPGTELHAHELVNSKGKWGPMKNLLRVRIKVFELVLRAIVQHGAHLIVEGIDVTHLKTPSSRRRRYLPIPSAGDSHGGRPAGRARMGKAVRDPSSGDRSRTVLAMRCTKAPR